MTRAVEERPHIARTSNLRSVRTVWLRELIRVRRARTRLIFGFAQPFGFLIVMGFGLTPLIGRRALAGHVSYRVFLFPGILAMSIIMTALFSTASIVLDREFGFMREMLVAPVSRSSVILGKLMGAATVAVAQGVIIIAFAPVVGVHLTVLRVLQLLGALVLLSFAITSFGVFLATMIDRMESMQVVLSLVMQPMIFTSGALFPLSNLPGWLGVVCRLNPATYGVDLARRALLGNAFALRFGDHAIPVWLDFVVVGALGAAALVVAVRRLARVE